MALMALGGLFVLCVVIHNVEEAVLLPAWSAHAGRWHPPVGARQFRFAVVALTLVLVACAIAAVVGGSASVAAYLFSGYVFAMVANALIPHLLVSLVLRRYMPGTGTALLLNLPIGGWFLYRAVTERFVAWRTLAWVAPAMAIALAGAIPVLFAAGRRLDRQSCPPCTEHKSPQ